MRLAMILLSIPLFVSGNVLHVPTQVTKSHAVSPDAQFVVAMGRRSLRTSGEANEERTRLNTLLLLDDVTEAEMSSIKKLASTFAKLENRNDGAADLFNMLRRQGHTKESARNAGNLYTKYLQNPSAFHT